MTAPTSSTGPDATPSASGGPSPSASGGSRLNPETVLTVTGVCSVVLGGLIAAVTGPLDLTRGSWVAAYLVLVGGVAQCAMGRARTRRPDPPQPRRWGWAQIACWNVGSAAVIGGTLAGEPLVVDLGSALLVVALVVALHAARPSAGPAAGPRSPLPDRAYRALLLVLAISIPIGIVLSHLRHS
jgi:hypothetical protein